MLYICKIEGDYVFVKDTDDNAVDKLTKKQLSGVVKKTGLTVLGYNHGIFSVYDLEEMKKSALETCLRLLRRTGGGDNARILDDNTSAEVRHWGSWINPRDAEWEEDYDWQELSPESENMLDLVRKDVRERYPEFQISFTQGEKCWLEIHLRVR